MIRHDIAVLYRRLASMGPQLYRCGNTYAVAVLRPCLASFNGAATLSLRKYDAVPQSVSSRPSLQWGRNFIVAEMSIHRTARAPVTARLQWGRNFIVAEIRLNLYVPYMVLTLQWGRNFIVAEMRKPTPSRRAPACASMGPQLYRCGNAIAVYWHTIRRRASMGPQLYRCGNVRGGLGGWEKRSGFNGAATLSLRKSTSRSAVTYVATQLQWGRNFIVAEIQLSRFQRTVRAPASMGPQLYRCGN